MQQAIYLDYMATTPTAESVLEAMLPYFKFDGMFGNPASTIHSYGWQAAAAISKAREQVADLINADPMEII